jgi:hypothetical protein
VSLELPFGDHRRVGAEEDFEQARIAQLGELIDGSRQPCLKDLLTRLGDRVGLAPAPLALALLVEQSLFG